MSTDNYFDPIPFDEALAILGIPKTTFYRREGALNFPENIHAHAPWRGGRYYRGHIYAYAEYLRTGQRPNYLYLEAEII